VHTYSARCAELGCTRVVIAHRSSTIVDADLIRVMKDGEIVERGDHATLLAQRGDYYALVMAQLSENRAARRIESQLDQLDGAVARAE
jgi:ABC-type multidrug transport system fused ATPase/permease subunit